MILREELNIVESAIVIEMPFEVYDCVLKSSKVCTPVYVVLLRAFIVPSRKEDRIERLIHISCDADIAAQLLTIVSKACPDAIPFIESAIASAGLKSN